MMKEYKKNNRRSFLQNISGTMLGSLLVPHRSLFANTEIIRSLGQRKPFFLYIHFGSACGLSSGLVQPNDVGNWQKGVFYADSAKQNSPSNNPLMNDHIKPTGSDLILHQYNKWLSPIATDCTLYNGQSISLDHNVARPLRLTGSPKLNISPEWGMALSQNASIANGMVPFVITQAAKAASTPNITNLQASNLTEFKELSTEHPSVPFLAKEFSDVYVQRFMKKQLNGVQINKADQESLASQLDTLRQGVLPETPGPVRELEAILSDREFNNNLRRSNSDWRDIRPNPAFKENLLLAASLALTGVGTSLTIGNGGHDDHAGGSDVVTARSTAAKWIYISEFWKWVKKQGLDQDVVIVISHEFGRTPYNRTEAEFPVILDPNSNTRTNINSPGRDHSPHMGMLVINSHPNRSFKGQRFGYISDNFVPRRGNSSEGEKGGEGYLSVDLIGSTLMAVFPELFPTERIVRKHWNAFIEIPELSGT